VQGRARRWLTWVHIVHGLVIGCLADAGAVRGALRVALLGGVPI
jgi:hypothetical protein